MLDIFKNSIKYVLSNKGLSSPFFVFWIGVAFCAIIAVIPDLLPAFFHFPGYVWSPINSFNYQIGDSYYYAAWVVKLLVNGIPTYSPTATELQGIPLIETIRIFPIFIAALPGLFISDFRIVYIVDRFLSAALFFSCSFSVAWLICRRKWIAFFSGIMTYFCLSCFWTTIAIAPGFFGPEGIIAWIKSISSLILNGYSLLNIFEYDLIGDNFRYINTSISGPILIGYFALLLYVYSKESRKGLIGLSLLTPLMAFSYPSHFLICMMLLGSFGCLAFYRQKKLTAVTLFSIIVITAGILLIIGYPKIIANLYNTNELWNTVFGSERMKLVDKSILGLILIILLNKYTVSLIVCHYMTLKDHTVHDIVIAVGFIACSLACVGIFDMPQLWGRFLGRGIDPIWFLLVIISVSIKFTEVVDLASQGKCSGTIASAIGKGIIVSICLVISWGFISFAYANTHNYSRFIPSGTWEAYEWISMNLPKNANILTSNWDDISLLPIYARSNLVYGHIILDGRTQEEEILRYVASLKTLGFTEKELRDLIEDSPKGLAQRYSKIPYGLKNPPFLDEKTYLSEQFLENVIYSPYVKNFNQMPIIVDNKINSNLVEFIINLYNSINVTQFVNSAPVDYIMVDKVDHNFQPVEQMYELIFQNDQKKIYRVNRSR